MNDATTQYPRLVPVGDSAILIQFEDSIAPEVHQQVMALTHQLKAMPIEGVLEIVSAYCSVLLHYDCLQLGYQELHAALALLVNAETPANTAQPTRRWRVPVLYGGDAGIDLDEVARLHEISTQEVVRRHCAGDYLVYMIGFAPGWCYLGGLDVSLHTPRLPAPRARVPAGCISIGGQQAMLGGQAMPSGWQLLGQTPVQSYAPQREPAFLFAAGDHIQFYAVSTAEFTSLERAAIQGEAVAQLLGGES